jgi:hypothetical protein
MQSVGKWIPKTEYSYSNYIADKIVPVLCLKVRSPGPTSRLSSNAFLRIAPNRTGEITLSTIFLATSEPCIRRRFWNVQIVVRNQAVETTFASTSWKSIVPLTYRIGLQISGEVCATSRVLTRCSSFAPSVFPKHLYSLILFSPSAFPSLFFETSNSLTIYYLFPG